MPGINKTLHEFSEGKLHSGSKHGPKVKSRAQAIAIGLSEERKEGHHVKPKHHSFESSNAAYGHATEGKPNEHHIEQGHKTHGSERKNGGAGRHGHDESGHSHYSEHKTPHHPEGSHAAVNHAAGAFGYPGHTMEMDHEHQLIGGNYKQSDHEPAVLQTPNGQGFTAGHQGITAGIGTGSHGYGHQQSQKRGNLRLSGHSGAHQVGKRK